ncbi:hypothetical protein MPSEU_000625600 [Mayamaea pseudoterrestris]|nr:hypothetical protein MPSEU_000625600 [Mayamaea pseudoterrestris]
MHFCLSILICLLLLTNLIIPLSALVPLIFRDGKCVTSFSNHLEAHPKCSKRMSIIRMELNANNDESLFDDETSFSSEPLFYDDFADQGSNLQQASPMSSSSSASSTTLQDRLSSLRQSEENKVVLVQRNWKLGNWNVRGFSLDPWGSDANMDDDQPAAATHISIIVSDSISDDNDHEAPRVWIGRTDGSLLLVQLGTDYWTSFQSKLTVSSQESDASAGSDSNDNANESSTILRVSSQLERVKNERSSGDNDDEDDDHDDASSKQMQSDVTPFEILWQHAPTISSTTTMSAILHVLPVGQSRLFTSSADTGGAIQQWKIDENSQGGDDDDTTTVSVYPTRMLEGVHSTDLVCLEKVQKGKVIFSVATDGSLALWNAKSGDLVYQCNVVGNDLAESDVYKSVSSAASDGKHIFLGYSEGSIRVYAVDDLIKAYTSNNAQVQPCGQWLDNKDELAVTAIACAGAGSLGRGSDQPSTMILLTGSQDGHIKQWEVMRRTLEDGSVKLEQWPKLSTQRLPKKAHLFRGYYDHVTALRGVDATKFLSAALDGTIRAWSPATGKELFRMSGFTENIRNLCLEGDLLITNGMKQFVCVHDFDPSTEGNDFELEMPEYED